MQIKHVIKKENIWFFDTCLIYLLFFKLLLCKNPVAYIFFSTLQRSCTHISWGSVTCEHRPCFPVHVVLESLVIVFSKSVQVSRRKAVGDLKELFGQHEARNWRIESVKKIHNVHVLQTHCRMPRPHFKFKIFFVYWGLSTLRDVIFTSIYNF